MANSRRQTNLSPIAGDAREIFRDGSERLDVIVPTDRRDIYCGAARGRTGKNALCRARADHGLAVGLLAAHLAVELTIGRDAASLIR